MEAGAEGGSGLGIVKSAPRLPSLHSFSPFHQMTTAKSVFVKAQSLGNSR